MIENHRHDGNDLDHHLELAEIAGLDGESFRGGNRTQPAHQEFPADNDYRDPCRDQAGVELHQRDEGGCDEKFVRQRIEQYAHGRDLAALARQIAINPVGDGSGDEQRRSQQFFFSAGTLKAVGRQNPDQQRNAGNASKRDGVRKIHRSPGATGAMSRIASRLSSSRNGDATKETGGKVVGH